MELPGRKNKGTYVLSRAFFNNYERLSSYIESTNVNVPPRFEYCQSCHLFSTYGLHFVSLC